MLVPSHMTSVLLFPAVALASTLQYLYPARDCVRPHLGPAILHEADICAADTPT